MESLERVFTSLKRGEAEQVLIERALGQSLIKKISTQKDVDLVETYKGLGGKDPVASTILQSLSDPFNKINPGEPNEVAKSTILKDPGVAVEAKGGGGKGNQAFSKNAALRTNGQALHTLAVLGGEEFNRQFDIG